VANFEVLHSQAHNDRAFLYAFGLLELGGIDLRPYPLEEGRGRLQSLLRKV
jgi:ATP-dependent DNA ligase